MPDINRFKIQEDADATLVGLISEELNYRFKKPLKKVVMIEKRNET
jgi:hypothetical protein